MRPTIQHSEQQLDRGSGGFFSRGGKDTFWYSGKDFGPTQADVILLEQVGSSFKVDYLLDLEVSKIYKNVRFSYTLFKVNSKKYWKV